MANKNTLGIASFAEYFCEVTNEKDFIEAINFANIKQLTITILWLGSNVLLANDKIHWLIICLKNKKLEINGTTTILGAWNILSKTIFDLAKYNLDLSELSWFPSTIWGAVRWNAGLNNISIGDFLISATIIDTKTGKKEIWTKDNFNFDYRYSKLKDYSNKIFWEGSFIFPKWNEKEIIENFRKLIKTRSEKQPKGKSAGCFFKNTKNFSAGAMIDQCGCKNKSEGGAQVSAQHANFLINTNNATWEDFLKLMKEIKKSVKTKFNESLELEIDIIDWQTIFFE